MDLSGLEAFIDGLEDIIDSINEINLDFMKEEWGIFVEKVKPLTPYDYSKPSGEFHMRDDGYQLGHIEFLGTITQADWKNIAPYASYVNDGTVFIAPFKFWQLGMWQAEQGREQRYQVKFLEEYEKIMLEHLP